MNKKRGIIVGPISKEEIAKRLFKGLSLSAFAEEGGETTPPEDNPDDKDGGKQPTLNYEDLIAKARKEEKDKQYKRIEKLQSQVNSLTEQHNSDLITTATLQEQLKESQEKLSTAGQGDSEEIKTLKAEIQSLNAEKEELDKKVKDFEGQKPVDKEEVEKEIRERLEKEYEVKNHKTQILSEHKDDLLVPELVFGDTIEELDNSLKSALTRSEEIRKQMGISKKQDKRTPNNPTNPSSNSQQEEYSLEYLASLDPSSQEYREVRKKMGLR